MRNRWILILAMGISISASAFAKPNVVIVLMDDMGWSDLGCYGGDTPTPVVDRMAKEGLRFTQFYSNAPICSPSRVAWLTGQNPQRWRITSFLERRESNKRRGMDQWLDVKAPVLGRELAAAGYACGHFGKWHMGGQRDVGDAPLITEYGFLRSLTNFEGLGPRVLPLLDAYDGTKAKPYDLGSSALGRGPIRWEPRSVVTAAFVKEAIDFIDESTVSRTPFFIHLWPDDVHSPFFPPEEMLKKTGTTKRARYRAVLQAADHQLGLLFDRIRNDDALRDNTIILISSDNGPEPGAGSAKPLRGTKGGLYEGGIRAPLIVWAPGLMKAEQVGRTNSRTILSSIDAVRSLYALTETALPKDHEMDGENLANALIGDENGERKKPIFWRRPPDRPGPKKSPHPDLACRDGRWKASTSYDGTITHLFDLGSDEAESKDVADIHPEIATRLKKAMLGWNAKLPKDAGDPDHKP